MLTKSIILHKGEQKAAILGEAASWWSIDDDMDRPSTDATTDADVIRSRNDGQTNGHKIKASTTDCKSL